LLAATAVAAAACSGSDSRKPSGGSSAQLPEVRKANALCRREDPKIAAAEAIAPGVWFTANTGSHIQAEVDGLIKLGLLGKLAPSILDWERARSLLIRGEVRKADVLLLKARAAAASVGIHCSFGARPLAGLHND
jgi:hypothetical protein